MYIYTHLLMCVCPSSIYMHTYTRTLASTHRISFLSLSLAHPRTYAHTHTQMRIRTRTHARTQTLTHIHTYTHTHIHTYTYLHVHTYTHTHIHTCLSRHQQLDGRLGQTCPVHTGYAPGYPKRGAMRVSVLACLCGWMGG